MRLSLRDVRATDIKITTAIAVINPCNIARLSTTSINPSRKKPSRNDISPDYNFHRPSKPNSDWTIYRDNKAYLDGDDGCYSKPNSFGVIRRRMGIASKNIHNCLTNQKA
jgi:hypothetical protein